MPFRRPRRRAFRHKKGVLPLPGADAVFQIPGFPPGMGADEFGEYSGSGPKSDPGRGYIPGSCGKPYCRAALRLKTLAEGINNDTHNTTRFIVLSRQPVYTRSASKVSICFEGLHKSGSLYNMLGNFIYNDVNMLMIESRPIEGRSWEYRFFVDVEGSLADGPIQNALKGIAAEAVSLRILGNY